MTAGLLPSCPRCGSSDVTCPFDPSHVCRDCDYAWRVGTKVVLIGGRWDDTWVTLSTTPPRIQVGLTLYSRLDDPDTGEFLGGYVLEAGPPPRTLNRTTNPWRR